MPMAFLKTLRASLCQCGRRLRPAIRRNQARAAHRFREAHPLTIGAVSVLVLLLAVSTPAQNSTKRNDRPQQTSSPDELARQDNKKPADATRYNWEFAQPQFLISHIVVEHDAAGRGKVSFQRKGEEDSITEPVNLSASALERILKLWRVLRFLDSNENYQAAKDFAHLGTYKLGMDDGKRKRTVEFNWSHNSDAWNLAQEYRRVADQAIFIFDITVARENQPLNTPGLLNQLESLYTRNGLSDPKQLVALLKELRTDEHIPLIARNHADRLLKKIEK
jgi:hypothetical protein